MMDSPPRLDIPDDPVKQRHVTGISPANEASVDIKGLWECRTDDDVPGWEVGIDRAKP